MKKKKPRNRWLSNRRLVSIEAILLVGLLENLIELELDKLPVDQWVKTIMIMLLIAGIFGGVISVITVMTKRSLAKGQNALKTLPLPTPMLLIHSLILGGIYWLYATYW